MQKVDKNEQLAALYAYCAAARDSLASKLQDSADSAAQQLFGQYQDLKNYTGSFLEDAAKAVGRPLKEGIRSLIPDNLFSSRDAAVVLDAHAVAKFMHSAYKDWAAAAEKVLDLQESDRHLVSKTRLFGALHKSFWFEAAARIATDFDLPSEYTTFFIDTFDYSQAMTIGEFEKMTNDEVRWQPPFDKDLSKYHIIDAAIVNEVQIELTEIKPFLKNLTDPDENKRAISKIVVDELKSLQTAFTLRRFPELEDDLEDLKLSGFSWEPATQNKGQRAIEIVRKMSKSLKDRTYR